VADGETSTLLANGRAIPVVHGRSGELYISIVVWWPLITQIPFPSAGHPGRVKMRPPTDTPDGEITLRPHGDVARVGSGVDFDRVSVLGAAGGPAG